MEVKSLNVSPITSMLTNRIAKWEAVLSDPDISPQTEEESKFQLNALKEILKSFAASEE
ncbi:MAG: hypothetical protein K6G84_03430 [Lachnospiraceae bacterium]|nr:hypothetical protein [Lachnospiraceae bacterium]